MTEPVITGTAESLAASAHDRAHPVARGILAERGTRLGAAVIDWMLQLSPFLMVAGQLYDVDIGFAVLGWLVIVGLQWYMLSVYGQSIGKYILRIKIVRIADGSNGGFITNVLMRIVANGVLTLIPLYGLIDLLFIFRADRRCIHDHLAGTRVVTV